MSRWHAMDFLFLLAYFINIGIYIGDFYKHLTGFTAKIASRKTNLLNQSMKNNGFFEINS